MVCGGHVQTGKGIHTTAFCIVPANPGGHIIPAKANQNCNDQIFSSSVRENHPNLSRCRDHVGSEPSILLPFHTTRSLALHIRLRMIPLTTPCTGLERFSQCQPFGRRDAFWEVRTSLFFSPARTRNYSLLRRNQCSFHDFSWGFNVAIRVLESEARVEKDGFWLIPSGDGPFVLSPVGRHPIVRVLSVCRRD